MLSNRPNLSRVDVKFFSFKKWQKMGTLKKRKRKGKIVIWQIRNNK